jgi:hypothetical protein
MKKLLLLLCLGLNVTLGAMQGDSTPSANPHQLNVYKKLLSRLNDKTLTKNDVADLKNNKSPMYLHLIDNNNQIANLRQEESKEIQRLLDNKIKFLEEAIAPKNLNTKILPGTIKFEKKNPESKNPEEKAQKEAANTFTKKYKYELRIAAIDILIAAITKGEKYFFSTPVKKEVITNLEESWSSLWSSLWRCHFNPVKIKKVFTENTAFIKTLWTKGYKRLVIQTGLEVGLAMGLAYDVMIRIIIANASPLLKKKHIFCP